MTTRAAYAYVRALLAMLLLFPAFAANAKSERAITDIRVTGLDRLSPDFVFSRVPLKKGRPYDAATADRALRDLFATAEFKDVQIVRRGSAVIIKVVENPLLASHSFSGNAEIKTDKLEAAVKLKANTPFTDARLHEAIMAIRDAYREEGRLTTKIDPQVSTLPGNKVSVAFAITEGPVDKVLAIRFDGNKAVSAHELEGVIKTVKSSWLDIFKSDSTYVASRLDDDRVLLRQYYVNHGFPDAKILGAEGTLNADGKGYTVTYHIDEGDRFTVNTIDISSTVPGVETANLTNDVQVKPGDAYNATLIDRSTEKISLALWDKGVRSARIKPKLVRNGNAMSLTFVVEQGQRLIVDHISIAGNVKTHEEVIRRELTLTEGEEFNPLILERDKAKVKSLGFFKSVDTEAKPGASPDRVNVVIKVVEDETTVLSFGGGYSSSQGLIGDISVEEKNLFGTGRDAKIKFSGSFTQLNAELGFTEPHLLGTNATGGIDLFYHDLDMTDESSYKSQKVGGTLRVAYPLSDTVTGSINYTFTQNTIYDVGATAARAIQQAGAQGTYYTSSVGYALAYDTRNSPKLPTSGTYFTLAQDFAGVGGDVRYIKSTVDARAYFPVSSQVTLVSRVSGGNITGWGGDNVRLLDMFYVGGETVRGFEPAGIGPRDMTSANLDALGGQNYAASTTEARFALPLVPDDIGLHGAVFADSGTLFGTSSAVAGSQGVIGTTASLRSSVGAGLIWDSPIGALRADYAFPIVKQSYDKTQPFSFGMAAF